MLLKHAEQLSSSKLNEEKYDIIFASSGYESRATHLAKKLSIKADKKIVVAFNEHKEHEQRIKNDTVFKELGFSSFNSEGSSFEDIVTILDSVMIPYLSKDRVSVLIDYSCMTKVWYATIVNYFLNRESNISNLELIFCYTPSVFASPQPPMPNRHMGPIPGIFRVSTSYKPTALILGLGYEKEAAKGLVEYLDPEITYAFYSKPAFDEEFAKAIETNNNNLIESLGSTNIFPHPINDLKKTDILLSSLCLSLRKKYRIILAPLGPKPFALMCLLIATKYPDIDVWRVSSGDSGNIYDRVPANIEPVICKVVFEKKEILEFAF